MSINATDVVTQFGAYYKPGSDNQKNLRNMLYKVIETAQYFQNRPTSDTIYRGTLASLTRVVQPFQTGYTPISTTTFKANQFNLFQLKIDLQEDPDTLEATYLGFLADQPEQDRSKWPFVRWWIENHVMPKKDEDLELAEYFAGIYAAPTPNTAGPAGTSMDGLKKVIRGYNTGGRTNFGNGPIAMGAPAADDADFCTQIEEFVGSINTVIRGKLDMLFTNKDLELRYKRGKRKKYNMFYAQESDLLSVADFPSIKVKGLESHASSDLIWATIPANRIRPQKKAELANTLLVQQFAPRVVSAYTDWWEALNFEVPEFIIHNDQDLA